MGLLIGAGILIVGVFVTSMVLRRPLRHMVEDMHVDHARELFHQQREWLEARFVSVLNHADPGRRPAVGIGPLARRSLVGSRPAQPPFACSGLRPF